MNYATVLPPQEDDAARALIVDLKAFIGLTDYGHSCTIQTMPIAELIECMRDTQSGATLARLSRREAVSVCARAVQLLKSGDY